MTQQRCGTSRCGRAGCEQTLPAATDGYISPLTLLQYSWFLTHKRFIRLWFRCSNNQQHVSYCASALCWRIRAAQTLRWLRGLLWSCFMGLYYALVVFSFAHSHYPLCSAYGVPLFCSLQKLKYLSHMVLHAYQRWEGWCEMTCSAYIWTDVLKMWFALQIGGLLNLLVVCTMT